MPPSTCRTSSRTSFIQALNQPPVAWRWYQNGYDAEPNDSAFAPPHTNYVSHHNGAQYFGYLANNPAERGNYRGENDFFTDMANNALPPAGGVFYIRGGYYNLKYPQVTPPIQNPSYPPGGLTTGDISAINLAKSGDDDHPSYTDSMLSEAMAARVINAIAGNPEIWAHSAIIITYDESDGFYDHVPPRILSYGPDKLPLSRGVRVPLIVVSPFAYAGAVSHAEGDHNSVIQTINAIFGRPALSTLPDEAQALAQGNSAYFNQFGPPGFQQNYLGPRDTNSSITDSLLSAFDPQKLLGQAPPLPASFATIPSNVVETFPHYGGNGCQAIGITPVDAAQGIVNYIPPGFNTLPATLPAYSHLPLKSHDNNGDSISDIAWRDTSGNSAIWLMNGPTILSTALDRHGAHHLVDRRAARLQRRRQRRSSVARLQRQHRDLVHERHSNRVDCRSRQRPDQLAGRRHRRLQWRRLRRHPVARRQRQHGRLAHAGQHDPPDRLSRQRTDELGRRRRRGLQP